MNYEMIPFHDRHLHVVRDDNKIFVVMKPIVEAFGLAWHGQFERIKRHPVLSRGVRLTRIPSAGGEQEMLTLELKAFNGWLVTISPDRIEDPDKRAVILLYQEEAFEVITQHFFGGRPSMQRELSERDAAKRRIPANLDKLERARNAESRRVIHDILVDDCRIIGIEPPRLEMIGRSAPCAGDIAAPFWVAIEALKAHGVDCNLNRKPDQRLSVNFKWLEDQCAAYNIKFKVTQAIKDALKRSVMPPYIETRAVNSRLGKTMQCWTFNLLDA